MAEQGSDNWLNESVQGVLDQLSAPHGEALPISPWLRQGLQSTSSVATGVNVATRAEVAAEPDITQSSSTVTPPHEGYTEVDEEPEADDTSSKARTVAGVLAGFAVIGACFYGGVALTSPSPEDDSKAPQAKEPAATAAVTPSPTPAPTPSERPTEINPTPAEPTPALTPAPPVIAPPTPEAPKLQPTVFTAMTLNAYYSTDRREIREYYSTEIWKERMRQSIAIVKDPKYKERVSVALFQEIRENQWRYMQILLGDDWTVYPSDYDAGEYASQNPIAFDNTVWELVVAKTIAGPRVTKGELYPDSMPQVKLRHRKTGQEIIAYSSHEPVSKAPWAIQGRFESSKHKARLLKRNGKSGIPQLLGADVNAWHHAKNPNQPTKNGDFDNHIDCRLSNVGMFDITDFGDKPLVPCQPGDSQSVDRLYVSEGLKLLSSDEVLPRANGSDRHRAMIGTFKIPSDFGLEPRSAS